MGVVTGARDDDATADASPDPAAPAAPRRGSVIVRDRRRIALAVAALVALAAAGFFGLRLVRTLAGDEADSAPATITGPVGRIVPNVVAFTTAPSVGRRESELYDALTTGRHDVAVDAPVRALCATAALDTSAELVGRWERNGAELAATDASTLRPPGFADCIEGDGEPLADGTYQFVVEDGDGQHSAAATTVLGAEVVAQTFVNDGEAPICALRLAPAAAGRFQLYDASAAPIVPGASVTLELADVRQAVQPVGCDDAAPPFDEHEFRPDAGALRALVEG